MSTEQTWTLGALLEWTAKHLAQKGAEFPRLDAEVLLAHVAGCKRIDLYGARFAEEATPELRQRYRDLIRRRIEGCPVAYLVGKKEFFGLEFRVGPAVLIPRPDSEHLVTEALAVAENMGSPHILDVGTGSGNLAVALARHLAAAGITATDKSSEALAVARGNAERHGVANRISFIEGDVFGSFAQGQRFDIIVSNPPYIPTGEIKDLPAGVRDFEPHAALDGGPDGFLIFQLLVDGARDRLTEGGYFLVEIGAPQETAARARIERCGDFELAPTIKDYSGHPRVLRARRA